MARPNRTWNPQRAAWIAVCVLACASCTSRDEANGGAAHGGSNAGKGGSGDSGGKGGNGESGAPGPTSGKGGQGSIAGPGSLTPVDGGYCCTPSTKPNCCMVYGGFTPDKLSGCGEACDGMPSPGEAWTLETDAHGCKQWVEPREWTDCCGCLPHSRICDPDGVWKIEYEASSDRCAPIQDVFTRTSDDDAGTAEVAFQSRGQRTSSCSGGNFNAGSSYEATVTVSENGCALTLASHATWCTSGENQCDHLELKVYLNPFKAETEVYGTYRMCWCGGSGPAGTTVNLKGIAKRE